MVLELKEIRSVLSRPLITIFLFFFVSCVAFSQNPIVKEEQFFQYENDGPFIKTRIIERYYKNDQLANEKELFFEEELKNWHPRTEIWFDQLGNEIRKKEQYFFGANLGFYISDTHSTYTDEGMLLGREIFIKENKNSPLQLWAKEEVKYLEDCSFVNTYFYRENPNDQELIFDYQTLSLYDEECRFVERIYSQRNNENIEQLRSQVRIQFDTISNGQKRRIVEQLTCPDVFGCNDWKRISLMVFDNLDRVVINEQGARADFYRSFRTILFEPTQTVYKTSFFVKQPNQDRQALSTIEETIRDLKENILSYRRVEPTSYQAGTYLYNNEGLLIQENRERSQNIMSEQQIVLDTVYYTYQYHCNDLIFEQSMIAKDYVSSRTTYSYLNPIDCGGILGDTLSVTLFPNPTSNELNIEGLDLLTPIFSIDIIDSTGRMIENIQTVSSSIDVSYLANGLYFIKIKDRDGAIIHTQSFIKSR